MPASTYTAHKILDLFLRGVAVTPPSGVYVSLHTADPGFTGANEMSTGAWPAYARKNAALSGTIDTGFSAAASRQTKNSLELSFGDMNGAAPVTVTHFALWDAATAGNCLFIGPLDVSRVYAPADEAVIRVNAVNISVT